MKLAHGNRCSGQTGKLTRCCVHALGNSRDDLRLSSTFCGRHTERSDSVVSFSNKPPPSNRSVSMPVLPTIRLNVKLLTARTSLHFLPIRTSVPLFPISVSTPPPPFIIPAPATPVRVSAFAVPKCVADEVNHWPEDSNTVSP